MTKFCKNCIHWQFTYKSLNEKFGLCNHPTIMYKVKIDRSDDNDEKTIHTESHFSCIYHAVSDNVIIKLPGPGEL